MSSTNTGTGTKKYTINYFINLISNTTNSQIQSNGVFNTISPRLGSNSVAVSVLNNLLDGKLNSVINGNGNFGTLGKTTRSRLLKALQRRKKFGTVIL